MEDTVSLRDTPFEPVVDPVAANPDVVAGGEGTGAGRPKIKPRRKRNSGRNATTLVAHDAPPPPPVDPNLQKTLLRAKLRGRISERAQGRVSKQARATLKAREEEKTAQERKAAGVTEPVMTREDFAKEMDAAGGNTDQFLARMGFSEEVQRVIKTWEKRPDATDPKIMEKYTEKILKLASGGRK